MSAADQGNGHTSTATEYSDSVGVSDRPKTALGYVSWALVEAGRAPYVGLLVFLIVPYIGSEIVGDPVRGQSLFGLTIMMSGLAIGLSAPFLGAIADRYGSLKPWVLTGSLLMVPLVSMIWLVYPGGPLGIAGTFVILGVLNYLLEYNVLFHNAMITSVAPPGRLGVVSGLSVGYGQIGILLVTLFALLFLTLPGEATWAPVSEPLFGLDKGTFEHIRAAGPIAALLLGAGVAMLMLFSPDAPRTGRSPGEAVRSGIRETLKTIAHLREYPDVGWFLLARMFINDALVGTIIFAGILASGVFGWTATELSVLMLCSAVAAATGAFIGGKIDDRIGSKRLLNLAVVGAIMTIVLIVGTSPTEIFFIQRESFQNAAWSTPIFSTIPELLILVLLASVSAFAGICFPSTRAFMARLCPGALTTQFFGLYSLSGTATAFLAPMVVAISTGASGSQSIGYGSLAVLFGLGLIVLQKVRSQGINE